MGYDRLWTIPEEAKISIKAFKAHKVHYRDLRSSGMEPRQELATVMAVLHRLHARNVRILVGAQCKADASPARADGGAKRRHNLDVSLSV